MQIQSKPTFSIVVPLFNEEENIDLLVQTIIKHTGTNSQFQEIILVDDGSRDQTVVRALELAHLDGRIRLVQHEQNQGLGAAIRTGLKAAAGDLVLYTDADLPFDFSLIPELISKASESCIVAGYRLNRGEGPRRLILTKGYNLLIRLFFGLSMRDVNFACKIMPKSFLQKAVFSSDGSFIDVEILLESRRLGLTIHEQPLVYYPRERGLSTLSRPLVIFYILKEMFNYRAAPIFKQTSFLPRSWKFLQKSLKLKTSE
jgi:glycosyltransferase involved in cell wall biosynthesis